MHTSRGGRSKTVSEAARKSEDHVPNESAAAHVEAAAGAAAKASSGRLPAAGARCDILVGSLEMSPSTRQDVE